MVSITILYEEMNKKEILNIIDKICSEIKSENNICNTLRLEKYKFILEYLNEKFPMLKDKKYSIGMKIYWLRNNIDDFPLCIECKSEKVTHNRCSIHGYRSMYCSRKCSHGLVSLDRTRKTCLDKYGVENPSQNSTVKSKRSATNIMKYGVDNPTKNIDVINKIEKTKLERYGDKHYTNINKTKQTVKELYGVDNVFANKDIQNKIRKTNIDKYGVEHPAQNNDIKLKISEKSHMYNIHNSYNFYLITNPYSYPNFTEEYYRDNYSKEKEFEFVCRKCGNIFNSRVHCGNIRRCPSCYSSITTSGFEQELYDYIKSIYNGDVLRKNRTILNGKEIDILIPDKKIAIEFDGLYWHSELNIKDNSYHLIKSNECEKQGYKLIHIFEDEWEQKQDVVKSIITQNMNICNEIIGFVKIMNVDNETSEKFINTNSLKEYVNSNYNIGLFINDNLYSIIQISKSKNKKYDYEILNICNKNFFNNIYLKEMINYIDDNFIYNTILMKLDGRYYTGNEFNDIDFKMIKKSNPNYFYLNNGCSIKYQKDYFEDNYKNILNLNSNINLNEAILNNKITRIWDCGCLTLVKTKQR